MQLLLTKSMEQKLPSVSEVLTFEAFELCSSNVVFREKPKAKMSSHSRDLFQRCQQAIETRIKNEQNEVRLYCSTPALIAVSLSQMVVCFFSYAGTVRSLIFKSRSNRKRNASTPAREGVRTGVREW